MLDPRSFRTCWLYCNKLASIETEGGIVSSGTAYNITMGRRDGEANGMSRVSSVVSTVVSSVVSAVT